MKKKLELRPSRTKCPSHSDHSVCPSSSEPARLVGLGFRLWLSGYRNGDISYWEKAWSYYSAVLGAQSARNTIGELASWVRTVSASATREIEVLPETCPGFCRDECLAVAMIAASQHKTCPAMRACAFALIENAGVDEVVAQSERFGCILLGSNQVISPNFIVNAAAIDNGASHGMMQ